KTTLLAWLSGCLLSGSPFLGRKTTRCPVFVLTLETTCRAFEAKVAAALRSLGVSDAAAAELMAKDLLVSDSRELLRRREDRAALENFIWASGTAVAIVDPLYLLLSEGMATDLAAAGRRLRLLCAPFIERRCSVVLAHHAVKSIAPGPALDLADLAGAGVA